MQIMLRGDAQAPFRRCVRDAAGNILSVVDFPLGQAVDVSGAELAAVLPDIEADHLRFCTVREGKKDKAGNTIGPDLARPIDDPQQREKLLAEARQLAAEQARGHKPEKKEAGATEGTEGTEKKAKK